ncbi:hypothetical protein [Microvirga mediterraneensis]|uniref:Uncharacterized protein n=1 Tax=Microvirga mediterraneensis TaxID=2754695 RepID=A0A838BJH3_9HYPH|nr:hypothetical protein [Microvirga mediterraneensis]MBA1155697.1 hypothetical protein [Microvirga mediterraneensis]
MARFTAKVLGLLAWLPVFLCAAPVHADPFFVRVYGRTYKIDPRYPTSEPKGPKPQEAMKALPSDLAKGPGFKPSHEQVLAEVEERVWIARTQLDEASEKTTPSRGAGTNATEVTRSLAARVEQSRSPEVQKLSDRHRALNLLVQELRRSMDLPVRTPEAGFSRPKLSPEIEADFRSLNFDPLEAYYSFRRVKAAFRSNDIQLLARVIHYPLLVTGKIRRSIRNRDQLMAAKETVLNPRIREVAAKSTFETVFVRDKGMMLGEGEVWITHDKAGFGLGAINVE